MNLRITTAGVAALANNLNVVGLNGPVTFTKVVLGDGSGPGGAADDDRTALRSLRETIPAEGRSISAPGVVAISVTATAAIAYDVTEAGLMAQVGAGAEFLLAYWSNDGAAWVTRSANDPHLLAMALAVGAPAADLAVTLNPRVQFVVGGSFTALTDTPATYANAAGFYPRVKADGTGIELRDLQGTAPAGYQTIGELAAKLRELEVRKILYQNAAGLHVSPATNVELSEDPAGYDALQMYVRNSQGTNDSAARTIEVWTDSINNFGAGVNGALFQAPINGQPVSAWRYADNQGGTLPNFARTLRVHGTQYAELFTVLGVRYLHGTNPVRRLPRRGRASGLGVSPGAAGS